MQQKKSDVHKSGNKKSGTTQKAIPTRVDPETQRELMLAFTGSMLKIQCSYMMVLAATNEVRREEAKQALYVLSERTLKLLVDLEQTLEQK